MARTSTRAVGWTALFAGTFALARQAWRLRCALRSGRAAALEARAYQRRLPHPGARVLVLGDSTGVGVGAASPAESFAGLLGRTYPGAEVINLSSSGARLNTVIERIRRLDVQERFDLVLLHVGGNDVLAGASSVRLASDTRTLMSLVRRVASKVLWIGIANIGLAPPFFAPLSWWMSTRARKAAIVFRDIAQEHGVRFIDFHREAWDDPFSKDVERYFAPDGVHPSAASYRYCFEVVRREVALDNWLGPTSACDHLRQLPLQARGEYFSVRRVNVG